MTEKPDLSELKPVEYYDELFKDNPNYQAAKRSHAEFVKSAEELMRFLQPSSPLTDEDRAEAVKRWDEKHKGTVREQEVEAILDELCALSQAIEAKGKRDDD